MSAVKRVFLITTLILLVAIISLFAAMWWRTMYKPMLLNQDKIAVKVYPGNGIHDLARILYAKRLITHPGIFVVAARISGHARKLRFGEYWITSDMSASTLLAHVTMGQGVVKHRITLIEGWTFRQVMQALMQQTNLFHRLTGKTAADIMMLIGYPGRHPEGLFFPETYTFIWGNTDIEILRQAYRRMQTYLTAQWQHRATGLRYKTPYQALIVASLIEKETSVADERPMIASVILRRLAERMPLQIDPTVLYGLQKPYGTLITRRDLQSNTPYNTYRVYGLPPTPIDMPGKASIYAALHPADTDYLYYVATGDGRHVFSRTYQQHLRAVRQYRKRLKQRVESNQ